MDKRENKAETKRITQVAGLVRSLLDKRKCSDTYDTLTVADLLVLAEAADTLSALVLHADTQIAVME